MADDLLGKANARIKVAQEKLGDAIEQGREKAEAAVASSKTKVAGVAKATRSKATSAAGKTVENIEHSPLIAVIGGLAIGAIAAAILPHTKREDDVLGGVGAKVRKSASTAAKAAKNAGKEQLDAMGVSADAAKAQFRDLATKIGKAATTASSAAAETLKKK